MIHPMSTAQIRQKLHNYLETANDKKVKAIYTMMEEEIEQSMVEYNEELKQELDSRYGNYREGKSEMVTEAESKKRISKLLGSAK